MFLDVLIYSYLCFFSLLLMIYMYKYLLILLMLVEMMVVNIVFVMFLVGGGMIWMEFIVIYYLVFSVCESVLGLGLLAMVVRFFGGDLYYMFNMSKF